MLVVSLLCLSILQAKGGICKVKHCQKYGSYLKCLSTHLKRNHPTLSEKNHRYLPLPPTMTGIPNHMKYRKKETCKLCGKTLLLLPHLKRCHKIYSREDYEKLPCLKNKNKSCNKLVVKEKHLTLEPDGEYLKTRQSGLFKAFQNLEVPHKPNPVTMTKQTTSMKGGHRNQSKLKSKPKSKKTSPRNRKYSLDEMVRYFAHKMYPYQVIAMGLTARKHGYKNRPAIVSFLHKTCMNNLSIADCDNAIDYLQYLCPYFRFCPLFEYSKFKCICTGDSSCTPLTKEFRLYCKRQCPKSLKCGCKLLDDSAHACIDFYHCKVCAKYYKSTAKQSCVKP